MCEEGKERMGEKEFKAKGFLLYTDDEDFFKDLDDDEAGILIKALFRYFNRGEMPKEMPKIIKMGFNVIRKEIDRDSSNYEKTTKRKSESKKAWWRKQKGDDTSVYSSIEDNTDVYTSIETKTKTQARAEAQTEALAKTKTKKTEVDASLVGGSASPPSMEETYGKSNGNSVYHAVIGKMLDERDKEDVVGI